MCSTIAGVVSRAMEVRSGLGRARRYVITKEACGW